MKINSVQDIPKLKSHNIIKYPQYKVNDTFIHKNFTSLYPQELHRNSLHFTRCPRRLDQSLVYHHYRHNCRFWLIIIINIGVDYDSFYGAIHLELSTHALTGELSFPLILKSRWSDTYMHRWDISAPKNAYLRLPKLFMHKAWDWKSGSLFLDVIPANGLSIRIRVVQYRT